MYSKQASSLRLVEHYSKLFSLFSPPSPPQDVVTCSHHVPHHLLRPAPRTRSVPERERDIETNAHTLQIDVRYPGTYQHNIGGVLSNCAFKSRLHRGGGLLCIMIRLSDMSTTFRRSNQSCSKHS